MSVLTMLMTANAMGQAVIRYVKPGGTGTGLTSFSNASGDLQQMIADSSSTAGDQVWVAAGTYTPTVRLDSTIARTETFSLKRGVKVYGGFQGLTSETSLAQRNPAAHQTILSGDIGTANDASDNAYHVVVARYTTSGDAITDSTQLDGFIVTKGNANCTDSAGTGCFPTCSFNTCLRNNFGGGILIMYSSPVIQNCTFIANHGLSGGGALVDGVDGTGGIGDPILPESSPRFIACAFLGNTAGGAGAGVYNNYADFDLTNCVFSGNVASSSGGGVYNNNGQGSSNLDLVNCTFANNSAADGGGIFNGHTLTLTNSILWDNSATSNPEFRNGLSQTIASSNIEGNTGTLNQDPLFLDFNGIDNTLGTLDDNLRLNGTSPSRNQGSNSSVPADTFDVNNALGTTEPTPDRDRATRIQNTTVDHGAYEAHAATTCCGDVNGNGFVNVDDLLAVINGWGGSGIADIAFGSSNCGPNGVVNVDDLLLVINSWGACPTFTGGEDDMPTSVNDCMNYCSQQHPGDQAGYTACVNDCVEALCKAEIIDCDE